ncbi:MAG: PIN domain-containing protein [Chloroflexota bacterium]|nr:PIN domain-containing protein [Chloroflexota bacterium]
MAKQAMEWLQELTNVAIEPVTLQVAERGAGYRHGLGMSTADALILATFVLTACDLVLSRDEDFKPPAEQGLIVLETLGGQSAGSAHHRCE